MGLETGRFRTGSNRFGQVQQLLKIWNLELDSGSGSVNLTATEPERSGSGSLEVQNLTAATLLSLVAKIRQNFKRIIGSEIGETVKSFRDIP
jgi:hypothetical protein